MNRNEVNKVKKESIKSKVHQVKSRYEHYE